MAKLTISDAARVAGVARSTLHRAIKTGRLSVDPDGHLDTAELLRAGYTLQGPTPQAHAPPLHDATPHARGAQHPATPAERQTLLAVQQERDLLRLERDLLRQQLETAQAREHAAVAREQEARDERQAAREREALLLHMVEQMQQRYDRLLDRPRPTAQDAPLGPQPPSPVRSHQPRQAAVDAAYQRMVALQAEGWTLAQIAAQLTQEGYRTRQGRPWHKSTVSYVLRTYGR
jgi:hypothetical protein